MCVGEESAQSYTCQNKYGQNVNSHLLVHSISDKSTHFSDEWKQFYDKSTQFYDKLTHISDE